MKEWTLEFIAEVERLAEHVVSFEGMTLIDVEFHRGPGGWVLRVFIDKPEGVTLEDCAAVSRQLGDVLDAKLERDEPYHLEVSSPGL